MDSARVLMIGLDGFEPSIAERLMAEGRLPALARFAAVSAVARLDHGAAKRTGLAWEHVATGLSPEDANRWSPIGFDPFTYSVVQRPTDLKPFAASLDARTVVFDAPYFDLPRAPGVRGLVSWGAHDPGTHEAARPQELAEEIAARFGSYPAKRWLYGFTWPSPRRTRQAGKALVDAVDLRGDIADWLLSERMPDWTLGLVVVGEYHSAVEQMWHGVDPAHPLHHIPSAKPAREGLEAVYVAGDRLIARLAERFPDARLVLFNLHGMGPNHSDVASMVLLPELLHRHAFGKPRLRTGHWQTTRCGVPLMREGRVWEEEMDRLIRRPLQIPVLRRIQLSNLANRFIGRGRPRESSVDWMPATSYRREWPLMPAFALPSFYDGRIRINLKGRERHGIVEPEHFHAFCDGLEALLGECRDALSGEKVIAEFERGGAEAGSGGATAADLTIVWKGSPLGIVHPTLGKIGPLPYRRTGGHTGKEGVAYFSGPGIAPGDCGTRSAFDVVPTVIDLLGAGSRPGVSGSSLINELGIAARNAMSPAC